MSIWNRIFGKQEDAPTAWPPGPGGEVLRLVYTSMQIDPEWSTRQADGFTWWAHQQAQRVWSTPAKQIGGFKLARVVAETEVATNAPESEKVRAALQELNRQASLGAFLRTADGRVTLAGSMVVHGQNVDWAQRVFNLVTALQPSEAARAARVLALAGASPARSEHPTTGARPEPDEMFDGVLQIVADGVRRMASERRTSPIAGDSPLQQLEGMLNQAGAFANADEDALTAELPFGRQTSLLQVRTDVEHPIYGPGVLMLLSLPTAPSVELPGYRTPLTLAEAFNLQARSDSLGETATHAIGGWVEETDRGVTTRATFLPAVICQSGMVLNLALGAAGQANQLGDAWGETLGGPGPSQPAILRLLKEGL